MFDGINTTDDLPIAVSSRQVMHPFGVEIWFASHALHFVESSSSRTNPGSQSVQTLSTTIWLRSHVRQDRKPSLLEIVINSMLAHDLHWLSTLTFKDFLKSIWASKILNFWTENFRILCGMKNPSLGHQDTGCNHFLCLHYLPDSLCILLDLSSNLLLDLLDTYCMNFLPRFHFANILCILFGHLFWWRWTRRWNMCYIHCFQ